MEDTENLFANLLDDLASGAPLLQKAALSKISKLDAASFQKVAKMIFGGKRRFDETILTQVFKSQRPASLPQAGAQEEIQGFQDFANKSNDDILADWKSADTRIKLAMLKHAAESQSYISVKLCKMALKDENPLVRLEAENMNPTKEKPAEMSEAEVEALVEKLASENPFSRKDDPLREKRALVVDDSKTVQNILKKHLSPHISVGQALSAEEALTLVKENYYDIIFLDIAMPGKSGLDLLGELRDRGLKSAIIVMSSLKTQHIIQTAFLLGANFFISKDRMAKLLKANKILEVLNRF